MELELKTTEELNRKKVEDLELNWNTRIEEQQKRINEQTKKIEEQQITISQLQTANNSNSSNTTTPPSIPPISMPAERKNSLLSGPFDENKRKELNQKIQHLELELELQRFKLDQVSNVIRFQTETNLNYIRDR